jgi:hypothetical protein
VSEAQTIKLDAARTADFEKSVREAMGCIQAVYTAAIEAVCGGAPRAQDVGERFGIHRKLAWQVWNVAYAREPAAGVRFMPSVRGIELWHDAAVKCGLARDLLDRLLETATLFDRLVQTHARDREMLELLVEACDPVADESAELRWRKQAFTGNCFVWGVRAKVMLACAFLHPARRAGFFDMVRVQGLIGLVRTRPNVRWPFAQSVIRMDSGEERRPQREPLMASADGPMAVPLMDRFCSRPLPPVQRRIGELGLLEDELLPGPVGQTGECTVITGELLREVAPAYSPTGEMAMFGTGVRTPGELLICDQFVHRDLFAGVTRELHVYSELVSPVSRDERDRLPVSERLLHLGRGLTRVRTADVPQYGELLEFVFERTGWNADEFDVFRARLRYPPIPVSVMVRHEMPAPPPGLDLA